MKKDSMEPDTVRFGFLVGFFGCFCFFFNYLQEGFLVLSYWQRQAPQV